MQERRATEAIWIRQARLASGLTAARFAETVGVSRITLWRWESGKAAAPQWVRIVAEHVTAQAGSR
jgi:transcriptional regulator with XRE-family HTH domain